MLDVVKFLLKYGVSSFDRILFEMERKVKEWDDVCLKGGFCGGKKFNLFRMFLLCLKWMIDMVSDVVKLCGYIAIVDLFDSAMEA